MKENCATSIFLQPTDEIEIKKVIMKCEAKTSSDINGISMKVVKRIAPKIIVPLVHICNLSIETGVFPDGMKKAKITPIPPSRHCLKAGRAAGRKPGGM